VNNARSKIRVGLAVVAMAVLASGCDRPKNSAASIEARSSEANATIEKITADPQLAWLSTLRRLYPSEYAEIREKLQKQIAQENSLVGARMAMADAIKPIMARHKEAAKHASDKELVEYLRRNTRVAEALARDDVRACTDVFHGALDPRTELPDETWKLMSEATAQLLVAAKQGEVEPARRDHFGLSPNDYAAWRVEMEKVGADADSFDLITNPERKASATDEEKCRVRIQMMKGALALPKTLAARITLNVL
jgi:hypothetical protein